MVQRKGIVLAGGSGTRLYPITQGISKQLLPVFDKPMVYYPLSVLMLAQIRDILIISTPHDIDGFRRLLGDGSRFGVNFNYSVQESPDGLAQALIIGDEFLDGQPSCLVLGDNIFYGAGLSNVVQAASSSSRSTVFGYYVNDPERYGVAEFDSEGKVVTLEEKPENPKSNYAVTGLYFYDEHAPKYARDLKPSARGELEITALNNVYLEKDQLDIKLLGRGFSWHDTGTHDSLYHAGEFVKVIESRQGLKIACLEEIAWRNGWISDSDLSTHAQLYKKSQYGKYLSKCLAEGSKL